MKLQLVIRTAIATTAFAILAGCNSGSGNKGGLPSGGALLRSVEYGRLVNIYAYQRIDATRDDRRDTVNRRPVLIAKEVVIRPDVEHQNLFDTFGNARVDANYRFLPFDVEVGHEEVVILWDNRIPPEKAKFDEAFASATNNLPIIPGSYRTQDTSTVPIPVVPRNAAICLNFDRELGVDTAFFSANPNAVQVLEFITPLNSTSAANFRPIPARVLANGSRVVIDTSLVGGEAQGGRNTDGLPPSGDNQTANVRIALPTVGVVSRQLEFASDPIAALNGLDSRGDQAVIRDFRSGNIRDREVGALADVEAPMVVTHVKMGITEIDTANRILTVNKRNYDLAIRGRIPYVDGALDAATGLASGPAVQPLITALRSGDVISQVVRAPSGEQVRIRAEVVMNLDVGNTVGDPAFEGLGMYRKGSDPTKPADGGQ
ncbi:MAG: hypothetical protein KDC87_14760, partial [Planctomycetes bacterium]|nr:hypothetical protein [Planctomycetota bacterium]